MNDPPISYYAAIVLFFVCFISQGIYIRRSMKSYRETIRDAVNHNETLTSFVYRIKLPRDEILQRLRTGSKTDKLGCAVDSEGCTVVFSHWSGCSARYLILFQEADEGTLVWLGEVQQIKPGDIKIRLNSFMMKKLNAEIIPYIEPQ